MKIKLDENLPAVRDLRTGHNVDTVQDEGLEGSEDVDVFEAAQFEGRFLSRKI